MCYVVFYRTKEINPFNGKRVIKAESVEAARTHFLNTYGEESDNKVGVIILDTKPFDEVFY